MTQNRLIWTILAWAPAGLWALVIWQLGGDAWSAPTTSRFLGPLIEWLFPSLDPESQQALTAGVRKLAHPAVYGLLALLAYPASLRTLRGQRGVGQVLLTLGPTLLLAVADEWRQSGSAARTGSGADVVLDLMGAVTAFWLAGLGERFLRTRPPEPPGSQGRI
ncbi:VanZ family protein [Myxococcota bacterium]|nr:VanZ family protein [Myxococcota bacterium]